MLVFKALADVRRLVADHKGVTALEYGFLGALVIVVCVTVIGIMGQNLQGYFAAVASV